MKSRSQRAGSDQQADRKRLSRPDAGAHWRIAALLAVLTAAAFLPVLQNNFVNWDDVDNYLANPEYRGLSLAHLRWMFTTFHHSLYRPVTWMTLGLDYLVWGMDPFGYHLTSLLFHCANTILFYFVALRLMRLALPSETEPAPRLHLGAGFAALIFSLHPLRVEPVAWASGRENVVSALFFLLSVLCYLEAVISPQGATRYWRWMSATWAAYGLSLLSKAAGMTLPLALLVLDIYPLKRLDGDPRNWLRRQGSAIYLEKVPFLLMAVAAGVAAVLAKQQEQALHTLSKYTLLVRVADSFYGLAFYLWKSLAPFDLSPLYQLPVQPNPWDWPFILSAIIVVAITVSLFVVRHRWPAGLASWAFYGITLAPVLGIVQYGPQITADRYSYLGCLSWALLGGAGVTYIWKLGDSGSIGSRACVLCRGTAIAVLVGLGALTWSQTQVWKDSERLWRYALSVDPASSFAYHILAIAVHDNGRSNEAIELYRKSLQFDPNFIYGHYNLAGYLAKKGDYRGAAYHYHRVTEIDPGAPATAYYKLADALARQGNLEESIGYYRIVLQKDPTNAAAHNDLGNIFAAKGDLEAALKYYRRATELDPKVSGPYFNMGNIMVRQGRLQQAILYFQQAVKISPDSAEAHSILGKLLAAEGKLDEAIGHFRQALRIDPGFADAHQSLVLALTQQGKREEALHHHDEARRILGPQADGTGRR